MGYHFNKSLKVLPGVRLNLRKGMPSISLGGKGVIFRINEKNEKPVLGLQEAELSRDTPPNKAFNTGGITAIVLLGIGALIAIVANWVRS